MKKNEYEKPSVTVFVLQQQTYLLSSSPLDSVSSNLDDDDELDIDDTPAGDDFWGR